MFCELKINYTERQNKRGITELKQPILVNNITFRTQIPIVSSHAKLSYHDNIMTIGSCFADNIATHLQEGRFSVLPNPFGILYNPQSIADCIKLLWSAESINEEYIIQVGELWHSFLHHGRVAQLSKAKLLTYLDDSLTSQRIWAKKATRLLITLGSALAYEHCDSGIIVANCHKIPNKNFRQLTVNASETYDLLATAFECVKRHNPDIEIVLTISPIRHIRDGIIENQRSKAQLIIAAEMLESTLDYVHYFPAYEIVMDELRDYRFYKSDMIHPSDEAIDYIWQAFQTMFMATDTKYILQQVQQLNMEAAHKSLFPESQAHQDFLRKHEQKIISLRQKYPYLVWGAG